MRAFKWIGKKVNFRALIVVLFTKIRHSENTVEENLPPKQNQTELIILKVWVPYMKIRQFYW